MEVNNNYLAGKYFHRAQVIMTIIYLFQLVLFLNIESILIWLGQPPEPSKYAAAFVRVYLPGIFANCQIELLRRFLNTQGIFTLISVIQAITFITHLAWLYIFVFKEEFGLYGVAISANITYILLLLILVLYISFKKGVVKPGSWTWYNRDSFTNLYEYLVYGLPSTIIFWLDIWTFEWLILFAGYIGSNEQSATIITFYIGALLGAPFSGIAYATSSMVGNSIGANKPKIAQVYFKVSNLLCTIVITFEVIMILMFRESIASVFTVHQEVIELVKESLIYLWFINITDSFYLTASGTIRATGNQKIATYF